MDSHGDCLHRYALLHSMRVPELAAELVQETFLEALRGWERFTGRSSERTWLVGILKHRIVDHLRRTNTARATSEVSSSRPIDDAAFDAHGRTGVPCLTPGEATPSSILEAREFWDVFRSLPVAAPSQPWPMRFPPGGRWPEHGEETRELLKISTANLWTRLHRSQASSCALPEVNWFGE